MQRLIYLSIDIMGHAMRSELLTEQRPSMRSKDHTDELEKFSDAMNVHPRHGRLCPSYKSL